MVDTPAATQGEPQIRNLLINLPSHTVAGPAQPVYVNFPAVTPAPVSQQQSPFTEQIISKLTSVLD